MQKMNLLAGNCRLEVRKSGKPLNLFLPIELSTPVIASFAQEIGIGAVVPARLRRSRLRRSSTNSAEYSGTNRSIVTDISPHLAADFASSQSLISRVKHTQRSVGSAT
jgi:hypothetical protein